MKIVRWRTATLHVSKDGIKTVCRALVPERATVTRETVDWHLYASCFNCVYRLCLAHTPAGYVRPHNGKDVPLKKECPHQPGRGLSPAGCVTCTPSLARNWPCPNGCTDHGQPDPFTPCTVFPLRRPAGPDGRCVDACESTVRAMRRANRWLHLDFSDGDYMRCYHCEGPVCVLCGSASAGYSGASICKSCAGDGADL